MKKKILFSLFPTVLAFGVLTGCGGNDTYTVKFETNGGTEIPDVKVKKGEKVARPTTVPTKQYYVFGDWYVGQEPESEKFNFDSPINQDTIIFAHYTANPLPIAFTLSKEVINTTIGQTEQIQVNFAKHEYGQNVKDIKWTFSDNTKVSDIKYGTGNA